MSKYTIGVDYGSDSVRSLIVNAENGQEVAGSVFYYPRWKAGKYCNPSKNQFRQHPLDYIEGLEFTIREALSKSPDNVAENVVAISVDTTGSTPVAVNEAGIPLSLLPEFAENPNAMFVLWKDHTATQEAEEINTMARSWGGEDYTKYEGGIYSSEWFWAKLLHVLREDAKVREASFSWVEHCDWIPALITGNTDPLSMKRSRCAAGHKALWHEDWDGLPPEEFLVKLDPLLKGLRERLFSQTDTCDIKVGNLSPEWATRLGLPESVSVGVGAFDAHLGAIGGEIKPYYLSKVMGTSTCDILIAPEKEVKGKLVKGICGQVDGSVVPGMMGLEAGQSAFGDVYAWFKELLMWPVNTLLSSSAVLDETTRKKLIDEISSAMIPELERQALKIPIGESGVIALDWMNGRRTPDANQLLKGAITGITLGTDAPRIYRALVEATAFGAKKIVDRFIEEGVEIKGVIALGGVAKKSKFVMQTVSDVLDMPILVASSEQACALGSAMAAAVVGGLYPSVLDAQKAMSNGFDAEYQPDAANAKAYKALYEKYSILGGFIEQQTNK
ncbi:ribulokinase [Microbacter margulisiae]|uniref:Ribulokinase n=1 Tax=Microbacter margulisiae TaxID=1350067 RepID=A0A7W5DT72_9PORP|nr:ribulokinase [Microbacter margulisiae]MBB3188303.1 L-ribulokinase [Microbacter margulisiae]